MGDAKAERFTLDEVGPPGVRKAVAVPPLRLTPSVPIGSRPSMRIQKRAVRADDSISASLTVDISQGSGMTLVPRDAENESRSGDLQPPTALVEKSAHVEKLDTCGIDHKTPGIPTLGPTFGPTTFGLGTRLAMQALRVSC